MADPTDADDPTGQSFVSYAQHGEDVVLLRAFRERASGFYVDVGAFDPTTDSVTRLFYDRGWRGINIDPDAGAMARFDLARPEDRNLAVAVGASDGDTELFVTDVPGWSTVDPSAGERLDAQGHVSHRLTVPCRRLSSILDELPDQVIDFLKVDAEGSEEAVIAGLDLSRHRPRVVVLEGVSPGREPGYAVAAVAALVEAGYVAAPFDGLNYYLTCEPDLLPVLSVPANPTDGYRRHEVLVLEQTVASLVAELDLAVAAREAVCVAAARVQAEQEGLIAAHEVARASAVEEAGRLRVELEAIRKGISWRMTAPVRAVGGLVRPGRRPTLRRAAMRVDALARRHPATRERAILLVERVPALAALGRRIVGRVTAIQARPYVAFDAVAARREATTAALLQRAQLRRATASALMLAPEGEAAGHVHGETQPTLALVSAWPPVRSGVADFAAATVEHLGAHYDVTVVDDQSPPVGGQKSLSRADFGRDWWRYDRIVYHVGNNAVHADDLELLASAPGAVVVHDAVLSGAIRSAVGAFGHPGGIDSLLLWDGPDPGPERLDLRGTRAALAPALGLLVHSTHARDLLREAGVTTPVLDVSPLPVPGPAGASWGGPASVASPVWLTHFGFVNAFKGPLQLVEAAAVLNGQGRRCRVAFVGEFLDRPLRGQVTRRAAELGVTVEITGFVTTTEWADWLASSGCAVQLRSQSHGESSAALGELLASGLPVVCTDVGSFAELPEGVVRHVPPEVDGAILARVIAQVLEPEESRRLASAGRHHAQTALSPQRWAEAVHDMVERAYAEEARLVERRVWLSDTSVYAHTPFFSGIQRVTLCLHRELVRAAGAEHLLFPTTLVDEPLDDPHPAIALDPLLTRVRMPLDEAEWLLCLDLDVRLAGIRELLLDARARGLRVAVNVYDILPVLHPEWFPRESGPLGFAPWLQTVLDTADLLIVNSVATADDLRAWVEENPPDRPDGLELALMRLGSEIPVDLSTRPALSVTQGAPDRRSPHHFLMVGTVEPRKGHAQVLDAFETLWAAGSPAQLTVVGRPGWMVEALTRRMTALSAAQPRLRWEQGASDAELRLLYAQCTAVVMASEGEGFGLPVVEAASHGCPAVIRDLPVFREIAGSSATYFRRDAADLVATLEAVLSRAKQGNLPAPTTEHLRPWSEVASRLEALLDGHEPPLYSWSPRSGWRQGPQPS